MPLDDYVRQKGRRRQRGRETIKPFLMCNEPYAHLMQGLLLVLDRPLRLHSETNGAAGQSYVVYLVDSRMVCSFRHPADGIGIGPTARLHV